MECWHLTFSSVRRMAIFPSEAQRRAAVRRIVHVAGPYLILFFIADDHVHVVIHGPPERLARISSGLLRALQPIASAPLLPAYRRRVESRSHLSWLVGYHITQPDHHGLDVHPALWSGSCFQDLIGARVIPGFRADLLRELLPRLPTRALLEHAKLRCNRLEPATDLDLRSAGAARLPAAAAAALGIGPALDGKSPRVALARRSAVHLANAAGIHPREIRWALDISPRTARRFAATPVPPEVLRAIRLRLALEDAAR